MKSHQINSIYKLFEYHVWANAQLIELCNGLTDEQLAIEVEGCRGRIQPTLVHLISSEGFLIQLLKGTPPWPDDLDWETLSMTELLEKAHLSGQQLTAMAGQADLETRREIEVEGKQTHYFDWTVLLQVLHHGIEHRTQIKILLTQLGVQHPDLAAWDYLSSLSSA
jgi:uncharacterized damage-inducible protein DinB